MTARSLRGPFVLASLPLALLACGGEVGGGDVPDASGTDLPVVALTVAPPTNVLTIDGQTPATAAYTATAELDDGSTVDVTDQVVFTVDDVALASFAGATLTTGTLWGGHTIVRATLGGVMGSATLTVKTRQRYSDPAVDEAGPPLPGDPGALFEEGPEDAARAPALVYPADGVLVPPNLGDLEFHFYPGDDNTLFEISYQSDTTDVRVYTRCVEPLNGGCIYSPDQTVWRWIAESNRGRQMTVSMRATDDAGTAVGAAGEQTVAFSADDVRGGIYYWTTSEVAGGTTAIMRFDFASSTQTEAERFIGDDMTGDMCLGCHALSRDGSKLITAANGSYGGNVLLVDVGTREPMVPFDSTPRSAFSAWNPDGSEYVGVYADEQEPGWLSYDLNVFDGSSGEHLYTIDVGGTEENPSDHPDWSPDGNRIVYTHVGEANTSSGTLASVEQCSLRVVTRDGAGDWSEPVELTASIPGQSTYYPTFSPGGDIIVYNRSVCASGENGADCNAYDDPGATLLVMVPEAGANAVALSRANAPGTTDEVEAVQNSYPKWSPFTFRRDAEIASRLHWLTFSSNRNYGLREPGDSQTLIWMTGVDPDAALAEVDPSYPAFALPFQDLTTDNHTAQWAERVISIE